MDANTAAPSEPKAQAALTSAEQQLDPSHEAVKQAVKTYYGETLKGTCDLRSCACTAIRPPPEAVRAALADVSSEIKDKFYGCGNPIPQGLRAGMRVLDLGCGSGRDCYVAARMVGEEGSITGVDMTPSQLEVAQRHADSYCRDVLGYSRSNMHFVLGEIEHLGAAGISDESVDVIISNCVVNLSPDKAAVLAEAYRVLAPGGELHFSDVYADRRLPAELACDPVLLGECLAGAMYVHDFVRLCREVGFSDPRQLEVREMEITDAALRDVVGNARFFSITYRLFKAPGLLEEGPQENYGQVALYRGILPGQERQYTLDLAHTFAAGEAVAVSGNTAAMLGETWLAPYFEVRGDRATHRGRCIAGAAKHAGGPQPGLPAEAGTTGATTAAPTTRAPAAPSCCGAAAAGKRAAQTPPAPTCCAPAAAPAASCCAAVPAPAAACCTPAPAPAASCCVRAPAPATSCCAPAAAPAAGCCAAAPAPSTCP